ncbi:DegT/DnrJ/EryC1/StrS family aminotransferase [Pelagibacterales bacterium SAG-MED22]|nr:DegT/DnrJ/EryC1/StrS family aminotransferase [Pelagibacterales bacterium SAG-MED22]
MISSQGPIITIKDIKKVAVAVRDGWYLNYQKYIFEFEEKFKNYSKNKYAFSTSSCTGALHLALTAIGIKKNDEVIVPELTWVSSVSPILFLNSTPVFVDVEEDTLCIDPASVEKNITKKTKAIICVGLYGNVPNMKKLKSIAKKNNIYLIEDVAESLGSKFDNKNLGSFGDISVYSFNGTKITVTGEGGMLTFNNKKINDKIVYLSNHGLNPVKSKKYFWPESLGYKYKMSNLLAALGSSQLEQLNSFIKQRKKVFLMYKKYLNQNDLKFKMNPMIKGRANNFWLPYIIWNKKKKIKKEELVHYLKKNGADCRPFFYPLSSTPLFKRYKKNNNQIAYNISKYGICLPCSGKITEKNIQYVCKLINNFFKNERK